MAQQKNKTKQKNVTNIVSFVKKVYIVKIKIVSFDHCIH